MTAAPYWIKTEATKWYGIFRGFTWVKCCPGPDPSYLHAHPDSTVSRAVDEISVSLNKEQTSMKRSFVC